MTIETNSILPRIDNEYKIEFSNYVELKIKEESSMNLSSYRLSAIFSEASIKVLKKLHKVYFSNKQEPYVSMAVSLTRSNSVLEISFWHTNSNIEWNYICDPINYETAADFIIKCYCRSVVLEHTISTLLEEFEVLDVDEQELEIEKIEPQEVSYKGQGKKLWAYCKVYFKKANSAWIKLYIKNDLVLTDESKERTKTAFNNMTSSDIQNEPPNTIYVSQMKQWTPILEFLENETNKNEIVEIIKNNIVNTNRLHTDAKVDAFTSCRKIIKDDSEYYVAIPESTVTQEDEYLLIRLSQTGGRKDQVWLYNMNTEQVNKLDGRYYYGSLAKVIANDFGLESLHQFDLSVHGISNRSAREASYNFKGAVFNLCKDIKIDEYTRNLIKEGFKQILSIKGK